MRCCASSPAEPRGILAAALGAGTSSWLCLLSGAAPRTPSWCTSCSVLGSPQLRCRHPRPRSAQPCPIPALPYFLFLQSGTDAVGRRSPPPAALCPARCCAAHARTARFRRRRCGSADPSGGAAPPPPHQHRVGARRDGVNAPSARRSLRTGTWHRAPRSAEPPSRRRQLICVSLLWVFFVGFFFSLPTAHLHRRGGQTFGEGWLCAPARRGGEVGARRGVLRCCAVRCGAVGPGRCGAVRCGVVRLFVPRPQMQCCILPGWMQ